MKLNCRPGDLAIIICGPCAGVLVHVLRLAPVGVIFRAKSGRPHAPCGQATWEIKSAGQKLLIKRVSRETGAPAPSSRSIYGCIKDSGLRPLRNPGDDEADESHAYLPPVPQTEPHKEPA